MIYSLKYTDDIPTGFAGIAVAWFVRIRPAYRDDIGLREHEFVHVAQFWRTCGLYGIGYLLFKSFRLKAEVEAYKVQLQYCLDKEGSRWKFARFIAEKYRLDIAAPAAYDLLGEL
jgi:hypothetical protein